jgi:G:T/U mismatch-specific DNA glycosylase
MRASHEFPPVFDNSSEILILGSFPSVKSRQESFFYANPQNRFWKLMAQLLNESTPKDTKDKIVMLKKTQNCSMGCY